MRVLIVIFFAALCAELPAQVWGGHLENFTAGEAITAPAWIYISSLDGKGYKADAVGLTKRAQAVILVSVSANTIGQAWHSGVARWPSSLTPGAEYYLSAVSASGAMTLTKPTNYQSLGRAINDTLFQIRPENIETTPVATATWGGITGLMSAQTDLTLALADKLGILTAYAGDVAGLSGNLQLQTGVVGENEMASTTVVAGQYGGSKAIPVITFDADGRATAATTTPTAGIQIVSLPTDQTNLNAVLNTLEDVTGLSFDVVAGSTYWFRFVIDYTSAATTTGSRWTINGPAITRLTYSSEYSLTATTITNNQGLAAYNLPASFNATSASTGANTAIIEGFITPSANGTVIARHASEIALSTITAKAISSHVQYIKIN
jgi:hypothetical protein